MNLTPKILVSALAWLGGAGLLVTTLAAPNPPATLEEFAFQKILTYELGQSIEPLNLIADHVHDAAVNPDRRKELEQRLIAVLQAQATRAAKDFACRQLALIGTEAAVPALAALLMSPELSHMARYALDRIPGEAASTALREALEQANGDLLVGLIDSLGQRGDSKAIPALTQRLADSDQRIALAAAQALGKIGGIEAAQVLGQAKSRAAPPLRAAAADAYLFCADQFLAHENPDQAVGIYQALSAPPNPHPIRLAALQGLAIVQREKALPSVLALLNDPDPQMQFMAAHFVRVMEGTAITLTVAAQIPKLAPGPQAILLAALTLRGDTAALPVVMEAARSSTNSIRLMALRALASLGNATTVPFLAQVAAHGQEAEREAARQAMAVLRGNDIDTALASARQGAGLAVRTELARALAVRSASAAAQKASFQMFQEEMQAASNAAEKKFVLAGLAEVRTLEAFRLAAVYLEDETVQAEAAQAVVQIAGPHENSVLDSQDDGLWGEEVVAVLKKVAKLVKNPEIRNRALIDIRRKLNAANLAQGKPLKASGPTKGGIPELAVDGNTSRDSTWHGALAPSWLEVDLQKPNQIDCVHVFPYWDGRSLWDDRYYQYTVELSLDGEHWTQVVDMRQNTQPATAEGVLHEFAPVQARFARIHLIKDSASEGVRLVEFKVYGALP
jgi:HEAT repeat protein